MIEQKWAKNLPQEEKTELLLARHERDRERARIYAQNNKLRTAARKYNVEVEFLENLIAARNNRCAICNGKLNTRLYIDHDHITNKVRDILCGNCNSGLRNFKDSQYLLNEAIKYLKKHGANPCEELLNDND